MKSAFLLLFLAVSLPAIGAEIRLSAAASTTDAVRELSAAFAAAHPGVHFLLNFGSSGTLARQIEQGAPVDLFISANREWMDHLVEREAVAGETVRDLAGNTLVFVGREETKIDAMEELAGLKRLAIGSPRSVPAGQYARQAMEKAGIWESLAAEGKLVLTDDVRQALLYADRGEVDGAFVYRTDALLARRARILFEVPRELHEPVSYPIALTIAGKKNRQAVDFFSYLKTPEAKKVLEGYGFLPK